MFLKLYEYIRNKQTAIYYLEQLRNELYKKGLIDSADIGEDDIYNVGYLMKAHVNQSEDKIRTNSIIDPFYRECLAN